jgi:hypothetical protein
MRAFALPSTTRPEVFFDVASTPPFYAAPRSVDMDRDRDRDRDRGRDRDRETQPFGPDTPAAAQFAFEHGFVVLPKKQASNPANRHAGAGATPSHYMYLNLYGMGKLFVPRGPKMLDFATALVNDWRRGRFCALTENRGDDGLAAFFLDFDFGRFVTPVLEALWWDSVHPALCAKVRAFYPDAPADDARFTHLVLASGCRRVVTATTSEYKAGVHVVFPHLTTTVEQCLWLSEALIAALSGVPLPTGPETTWRTIIDQAVFSKARGLRWAWQFKAKPCDACADARMRRACAVCYNGVAVDTNASVYAPVARVHGDGRVDDLSSARSEPSRDLLLESSIVFGATPHATPGFVVPASAAPPPDLAQVKAAAQAGAAKAGAGGPGTTSSRRGALNDKDLPPDDARVAAIADAIARVSPLYKALVIKRVRFTGDDSEHATAYTVHVGGENARFCLNKCGAHGQSTVWFSVTQNGVCQRCFSTKTPAPTAGAGPGAAGVPCKKYKSHLNKLLEQEKRLLFPHAPATAVAPRATVPADAAYGGSGGSGGSSTTGFFSNPTHMAAVADFCGTPSTLRAVASTPHDHALKQVASSHMTHLTQFLFRRG